VGYANEKTKAVNALEQSQSIFITGSCGTGKSHLAYGLIAHWWDLNRLLTKEELEDARYPYQWRFGKRARFLPTVELLHELKSTFRENADLSEDQVISKYTVDDLLVLDDIGAEKVSDWSRSVFYLLIDRRYRDQKQTIFTSNLSITAISTLVDDRIASRLSTCEFIELKGEFGKDDDWRVNHAE
jgi:DNA replication protein DnaC